MHTRRAALVGTALLGLSLLAVPRPAGAEAHSVTAAGIGFRLPDGWRVAALPSGVVLTAPEGDSRIVVQTIARASDGAHAAARAWAQYRPGARPAVLLITPEPPGRWDEQQWLRYAPAAGPAGAIGAMALRQGGIWTVAILDSSAPTFARRREAVQAILDSLTPPDAQKAGAWRGSSPATGAGSALKGTALKGSAGDRSGLEDRQVPAWPGMRKRLAPQWTEAASVSAA